MKAIFRRGPDREPRKHRIRKLLGDAAKVTPSAAKEAAIQGLSVGSAAALGALVYKHSDSSFQRKAAIAGVAAGLLGGAAYGGYKGIKKLRQKESGNMSQNTKGNIARFSDEDEYEDEVGQETDYNYDLFARTVENIHNGVAAGVIDTEDGTALEKQAIQDYRDRVAEDLGYDPDEIDEEFSDYSAGNNVAEFQAGNDFAAGLVTLLEAAGYEDLEQGIIDLADSLGLEPEDTAGLITGEYVPSQEIVDQISDALELDDETYGELDYLGEAVRTDAGYEDAESSDPEEEAVDATYSRFSRHVNRLENQVAEFEYESELKNALDEVELEARHGVDDGWLPPIAYRELIGNFELEQDRIAAFSTLCRESSVSPETQLYGVNYALQIFKNCGPMLNFSSIADEPLDDRSAFLEEASNAQAELNYKLRKQRNPS